MHANARLRRKPGGRSECIGERSRRRVVRPLSDSYVIGIWDAIRFGMTDADGGPTFASACTARYD
jgi:hypothetical protein